MAKTQKKRHPGGRKKIEDKKIQVGIYIKKSRIEELGGIESVREKMSEIFDY